ncbi:MULTISPECIES: pyridoxal-phosphate dependent enzyme [Nocardia]|uniref:pyridoxal-phosphate dependent enzyme n=1 Tax=Nocardia TaxID=1817 RepID=UPI001896120D|nr:MULTISPECIES: pyridoxal-phosphate dependent enzyme [Nocardia]MBF6347778.1 pyridoxal-phosphate dependent enzyme [Nocardia flavorosea]
MTIYQHITELIGDTPLLRLDPDVHGLDGVDLYAKLESHNPFGSVKDRVAWAMLRDELETVRAEGRTLIEASSGNTAKALRVLGAVHGIGLRAMTNRIKVGEVRDLLRLLGTDIVELPGLSECPDPTTPNDVYSAIERAMAAEPDRFRHLSQYTNEKNIAAHHDGTGREIHEDLAAAGIDRVDYLIGGLGTTGSSRGAGSYLRKFHPELRTVAVVSDRGDFIPGIRSEREMWEVGLFQPDFYDEIVTVESGPALEGTLELATGYGILAGPTSGAAYAAARDVLTRPTRRGEAVAVLIVCDRLEPYLSYIRQRRPELFGGDTAHRTPGPAEIAAAAGLDPAGLADMIRAQHTVVVDTRGAMAYRIAHIPGAINIPDDRLTELFAHGTPFSRAHPVVFTCPTGDISRQFAATAQQAGHRAFSLDGGIAGWRAAGLELERG